MASDVMLQHLDYLLALAAERHFGRAAARCHVSQPTLSVAIRRLERDLGITIVQRGQRFEGFTEEGRRVVTWAQRIVAERDEMLADIERMQGRLTATARVGAIPTAVPASPFITDEFLRRNPAASMRIEALSSREIARRLADFEIDGGLTYLDEETPPGTRSVELYREHYVLVAPADDPLMGEPEVSWADAATRQLCMLTTAMRNRRILDANMAAEGAQYRPAVEADTVDALYAHLISSKRATIASTAWLPQLGIPEGFAARPMVQHGASPAIGLVVLDRSPASIVAAALAEVAAAIDLSSRIDRMWTDMGTRRSS
ncbi:LysR family transcriptional regulator [Mycolicibacterium goodii]|uniref:LysR family transcriptional regulator n=1 Tax=Mycolicibacterium goodii TaxID=134601 RepID=A0ABS6HIK4_MYCGD|nr:LysR family transcriptional regulator [Mycolicibacterium goodii]OKH74222.1 LysR family transcriptional regulator [Mycobacterium sp. SWH-M5]MBU8821529.1 LysR family transcriptional regulator [Mycolicibacterium goodii]MBU8836147.1 LysR family transcriptional regulator [Mycolicibacterium goodii]PJK22329.1 LysR family transcriptional regulator [Mycolicibacterium goodii]ULN45887.1 LysR family transcriptional regulator [Mycolicibacterium goodii]